MTDKEIIIDGVDIFGEIDEWADTISQEWNCDEYSTAKIIKSYILDINKQLARKTQECEELKEELEDLQEENHMNETNAIEFRKALEKIKFEVAEELKTLEADCDEYGTFLQIAILINEVISDE